MMQKYRLFIVCWAVLASPFVAAVSFAPSIDQSVWGVETSKFYCRLSQEIPTFGRGSFFHEAGELAVFELSSTQKGSYSGVVRLVAEASPWQPGVAPKLITQLSVPAQSVPDQVKPLTVSDKYAGEMLVSLYQGMSPTFTLSNWLGSGESARVSLLAANFQKSYSDYITCVDDLLPVNYRQIARTAVLYPPAQWRLSDASKERLDLIIQYVNTDAKVTKLYVDGHSDNAGRRLLNRDLSKQRAEDITRYLVANGISEDIITTRYHGERYPAVPNNSKTNRARNRRATIRLERE